MRTRKMFAALSAVVIALPLVVMPASATPEIKLPPPPKSSHPGTFGRMFPDIPAFTYSDQASEDLAQQMVNLNPDPPGVNNGTPDDSPGLAAWLTYFGQMLDHNLDADPTPQPTGPVNVKKLENDESGVFDMNQVFGGGPSQSPELYAADRTHLLVDCTLGTPQADGMPTVLQGNANGACDLARNADGTAIIADPRDDENQIISQMHVAWILFYNHFVDQGMSYQDAYRTTVGYYQLQIFDQQLPDFVTNPAYIAAYATPVPGTRSWTINTPQNDGQVPVEFAVGAYRFGHSLVREDYTLNDITDTPERVNNAPIFDVNNFQTGDLAGGAPLQGTVQQPAPGCQAANQSTLLCQSGSNHMIEWKYFFKSLNLKGLDNGITNQARQTQPTISPALFNLPANAIPGCENNASPVCNGSGSLIARDLARGNYDGLPSGQDVAAALGCPVIPAASLNPTSDAVFDTGTPLIYYVMAEAKAAKAVLGCTGSKIVAQQFLRALVGKAEGNTPSVFTEITPDPSLTPFSGNNGQFVFQDLLIDTGLTPRFS